jgi:prepilin-type N-terminal cleavage/methylation domain-containing protein
MKRNGFTMVELIMVIVVIGILGGIAVPKFTGVKDQAIKATDLSTASSVMTALNNIKSAWGMSEEDFDWNNDGVDDDINTDLSSQGYPLASKLIRNSDDLGALIKSSSKSGFKLQKDYTTAAVSGLKYAIYTSKATDPVRGIKYPTSNIAKDTEGKPDKNDFWIYVPESNGVCSIKSTRFAERNITAGEFVLIDVNGTVGFDFDDTDDSTSNFDVSCS